MKAAKALRAYEKKIGLFDVIDGRNKVPFTREYRDRVLDCAPCYIQKVRRGRAEIYLFVRWKITGEQVREWLRLEELANKEELARTEPVSV